MKQEVADPYVGGPALAAMLVPAADAEGMCHILCVLIASLTSLSREICRHILEEDQPKHTPQE